MRLFRRKKQKKNKIYGDNNIIPQEPFIKNVFLEIEGNNNKVIIKTKDFKGKIRIIGNNNLVEIGENVIVSNSVNILMGGKHFNKGKILNSKIIIGKNTSFESTSMFIYEKDASITIGKNCMFSANILIYNTDTHPIFSLDTNKLLNRATELKIEDSCWIGINCTILKNTLISSGSVVGAETLVAGKFTDKNIIIAGNPAKIIKRNIKWKASSNEYIKRDK